ncbi:PAS domain-containing sensor histidine kinase [Terriglobus sp. ADX1]|uniref:PAS domain-containing sensor histidine kinase n=1 Tax=Terriglobus sp. ADX1 TaxID=2794063 RepID=UPI002FE5FA95
MGASAGIWDKPERWLAAIIESSETAIMGTSFDGIITSWAGSATRMFGYTAEEAIGMSVYQLAWPGEEAKIPDLLAAVQHGERIHGFRTSRRHKDGHCVFVSLNLFPIRDERGAVVGVAKFARDMSERVREQQEQERTLAELITERKYRELTEHAPDGILEVDADGRIIIANQAAVAMFGFPHNELIGAPVEILIPHAGRSDHPGHRVEFMRIGKTRPMGQGINLNAIRKDGSEFPVEISLSPVQTGVGIVVIAVVRDVSARRSVEREVQRLQASYLAELEARQMEAERLNRLKSEFVASVSHELRTPLHTIIGFTDLLREDPQQTLTVRQGRFVENIQRDSEHLLELINDVLDLSRIEADGLTLHIEGVKLCPVLETVVTSLKSNAERKGIRIHLVCDDAIFVAADPTRLRQIVANLLNNAIKFTAPGGEIGIAVTAAHDFVTVAVKDSGIGIAEEEQTRIFDKFYQVGVTTGGVREGTGLGLAICKRLVEMQGGRIDLTSQKGIGSTFRFTLPCDSNHITS